MAQQAYGGSATVSTTEYSLPRNANYNSASPQSASPNFYQAFVDLANLVSGDQFRMRVYEAASTGVTQRMVYESYYSGVQGMPLDATPGLILLWGWDVTMTRTAGSDRVITWSIRAP
jgi:hypothetical protein